jgi:hypothetical protein
VHKQLVALALAVPLLLTACSEQNSEQTSTQSDVNTSVEPANPEPSKNTSDACAVIDQMQSSLSTAVTDLVENPDFVTAFNSEFDNQVILLIKLIESLQGDTPEQQKLRADLDAAVSAKDDAVQKFNDAQLEENAFSKTLGMADAALSARDAVVAAEKVLTGLTGQLQCAP